MTTKDKIDKVLDEVRRVLHEKNDAYGDSALNPIRIFSKDESPTASIDVRIDDKLSRIARGKECGEDTVLDLIGYLVLKRISEVFDNDYYKYSDVTYKVQQCPLCGQKGWNGVHSLNVVERFTEKKDGTRHYVESRKVPLTLTDYGYVWGDEFYNSYNDCEKTYIIEHYEKEGG